MPLTSGFDAKDSFEVTGFQRLLNRFSGGGRTRGGYGRFTFSFTAKHKKR